MKAFAIGCVLLLLPGIALAEDINKSVASGKKTLMHGYTNWNNDCSSASGIVKVSVKP